MIGIPAAAAQHPELVGAVLQVLIIHPLLDIATQIIQAQVVARERAHGRGVGIAIVITGYRPVAGNPGHAGQGHVGEIADFFTIRPLLAPRIDLLFAGIAPAGADALILLKARHQTPFQIGGQAVNVGL